MSTPFHLGIAMSGVPCPESPRSARKRQRQQRRWSNESVSIRLLSLVIADTLLPRPLKWRSISIPQYPEYHSFGSVQTTEFRLQPRRWRRRHRKAKTAFGPHLFTKSENRHGISGYQPYSLLLTTSIPAGEEINTARKVSGREDTQQDSHCNNLTVGLCKPNSL